MCVYGYHLLWFGVFWQGLFNMYRSSVFTINSLTSWSNSKTTSTHTNTVAKPDPKKVLVAITRLCNNYKLLSFIQELQKGGSGCETHYISCLYCKRKKQFPAHKFCLSLQTCSKKGCVMKETYLLSVCSSSLLNWLGKKTTFPNH